MTTTATASPIEQVYPEFRGNQANGICGIYGISGVGKTTLITTAVEFNWEVFKAITLVYSSDLGGWGNRLLSQIKYGVARVWYMRNHIEPFATMQLASMGAWPIRFLDAETGLTEPNVPLVLPIRTELRLICKNGHVATTAEHEAHIQAATVQCPTCQEFTSALSCLRIDRVLVRSAMFRGVGGRAYDSFSQLNDWGMEDLQEKSAAGMLPTSSGGGSALGSADALREGGFAFGTSSVAQYGFVQNRTYGWIKNIRAIPGHVTRPIATFAVEESKGDDESGGVQVMGPKIAGNKKTSSLPGWLGDCLHATREPDLDGIMRHRLWLVNHIDPRDPRKIPYLAKHRGEPGMPEFLQDAIDPESKNVLTPFSHFSLGHFWRLLDDQLKAIIERDHAKYKDAPGMQATIVSDEDAASAIGTDAGDVVGSVAAPGPENPVPVVGRVGRRGRRPQAVSMESVAGLAAPSVTAPVAEGAASAVSAASIPAAGEGTAGVTPAAVVSSAGELPPTPAPVPEVAVSVAGSAAVTPTTAAPAPPPAAVQPAQPVAVPLTATMPAAAAAASDPLPAGQMPASTHAPQRTGRPIRRVPRPAAS